MGWEGGDLGLIGDFHPLAPGPALCCLPEVWAQAAGPSPLGEWGRGGGRKKMRLGPKGR